ncbi:MAG: tetratricopeptide repeat protein [Sedimentisphaerales bacterium]|nr:tetratricopeptide repeat protein [Sedimentisphaerales bacterium]
MNLFRKNIDSEVNRNVVTLLFIISLFIHSNITLCQAAENQLDPISILSSDLTEKLQIKAEALNKNEKLYASSVQFRNIPQELPQSLQPLNGFWAVNLSQTNDVFQPEIEQPDTANQQNITGKQLISENFAAVVENNTTTKKDLLQNLIKQIGFIELKQSSDTNTAEQKNTEITTEQPVETTNRENTEEETAQIQNENKTVEKKPDPVLLAKIQLLKKQPELVKQPFMLAELLYLNGYDEHAAYFYNLALSLQGKSEKTDDSDKAWLLFQKANCQRLFEPQQAVETYKQLISEYPNSLWFGQAQANLELLQFNLNEEPEKIIELCRKQLNDFNYSDGATQE